MKKTTLTLILSVLILIELFNPAHAENSLWGRTGHYITGEIAQAYLNETASARVQEILGESTWDEATVWMDLVRRTPDYRHTADWHWVSIPTGMTYEESEKNPNGDIVSALKQHIELLKSGTLTGEDERDALRIVIHLIGDIHQPLHVGTGDDRGGNDVRVEWLGRNINLHSLWDTGMIESWGLDSEQMASAINILNPEIVEQWQNSTVLDWANESMSYRDNVYGLPDDNVLGWEYRNKNFSIVEKRMLQAGVRIAGVLNSIYGN